MMETKESQVQCCDKADAEQWMIKKVGHSGWVLALPLTARGHDYTMNFICNLTREAILVQCSKTITAKETAKLYFKQVLLRTRQCLTRAANQLERQRRSDVRKQGSDSEGIP